MENWDELVERKKKEIENDFTEDVLRGSDATDYKRALDKKNRRLQKVDALSEIESATQMMLKCIGATEGRDG